MRRALLLLLVLLNAATFSAQNLGIGYYDLDGLYDTIPSKFYDDTAYTPEGKYRWNTSRYGQKLRQTASVIDSMRLPIVGLYGVENESVVRDLVAQCKEDYSYIHRTRNSFDGQDFALLYFGDILFVESVEPLRNMLVVDASVELTEGQEEKITIILSRNGSDTHAYLKHNPKDSTIIILGKIYQDAIDRLGYHNPLKEREKRGEGNYAAARGWVMHDRIAVNRSEKILKSSVFITPWLLNPSTQTPLPTLDRAGYIGGYSKYLPVFIYIY
ncbi:MAG: hypothetical protein SNG49_01050 [Rikenellaceae bacterium]